jgi:hypothetical protein
LRVRRKRRDKTRKVKDRTLERQRVRHPVLLLRFDSNERGTHRISSPHARGVARDVPFLARGPAMEVMRAAQKPPTQCGRTGTSGATRRGEKTHVLPPLLRVRVRALAVFLVFLDRRDCLRYRVIERICVVANFTWSGRRGTGRCRSSCARRPRPLFRADRFRSWGARRLVRRSAVCLRHRLVFRRPSLESLDFQ